MVLVIACVLYIMRSYNRVVCLKFPVVDSDKQFIFSFFFIFFSVELSEGEEK